MEEPGLACPSCSREFEIPHKTGRPDDLEYLPVPRMLACLHTTCQSCLEDMRERSDGANGVICPICRKEHKVEAVAKLPLDVSILKNILNNSRADKMSFCSRCYDEVPSYSWCMTCSAALCEFHHQDHKLSMDTSKHSLQTFKEISRQHLHIEPKLPAIICPEIDNQECTAYCHDCNHVVSVHGAMQNHNECRTEDCLHSYNAMRARLQSSADRSDGTGRELKVAVRNVRDRMQELDNECARATRDIEEEFDAMRKLLNDRESALMERLTVVTDRKRAMLSTQLNKFSEYLEDCYLTNDVSGTVLRDTDDMRGTSQDAAYMVSMAGTIDAKVKELEEKIKGMNMSPDTDAEIAVSFNLSELGAVQSNVPILGCIQTTEDVSVGMGKDDTVDAEVGPMHSKHKSLHKPRIVQTHAPSLAFTIKSEPVSVKESEADGAVPKGIRTQNLVIEARSTESFVEEGKAGNSRIHGQGTLLGQVILITEMDKKLVNRHEIRSFFESVVIRNVPIMKITKEFLPVSSVFGGQSALNSPEKESKHERGRLDGRDRSVERRDLSRSPSMERADSFQRLSVDVDGPLASNSFARNSNEYTPNDDDHEGYDRSEYKSLQQQARELHLRESKQKNTGDRLRRQQQQAQPDDGKQYRGKKNDYLSHAQDKINRHGQKQHFPRESNY